MQITGALQIRFAARPNDDRLDFRPVNAYNTFVWIAASFLRQAENDDPATETYSFPKENGIGGGLVQDEAGKPMKSVGIDAEKAWALMETVSGCGKVSAGAYTVDRWIVRDMQDPWVTQERDITGVLP